MPKKKVVEAQPAPVQETEHPLAVLQKLVHQADAQRTEVDRLEAELKDAKDKLNNLLQQELPDEMLNCGLETLLTDDGLKVTLKDDVQTRISDETRTDALRWLRDHAFDDIIKNEVSVFFNRGMDKKKQELAVWLRKQGLDAQEKESVHPSTLKSFVKEQLANGTPVPEDLFNVHPYRYAKIERKG